MLFKYIVVETHTTTCFYFTAGASSEWGKLRSLCPWRLTKLDCTETAEVNSALSRQWMRSHSEVSSTPIILYLEDYTWCYVEIFASFVSSSWQSTVMCVPPVGLGSFWSCVFLLLLIILQIDRKEITEVIANKCLILTVCKLLQCRSQFSCPPSWFPSDLKS